MKKADFERDSNPGQLHGLEAIMLSSAGQRVQIRFADFFKWPCTYEFSMNNLINNLSYLIFLIGSNK